MYAWLTDALAGDDCHVVTANRRLARTLQEEYAVAQQAAGSTAWRRPLVLALRDWYALLAEGLVEATDRAVRINGAQSRLVWERALRDDLDDPLLNIGALARQCAETWTRLHEWNLPLEACQAAARGQDQRIFARAAGRYSDRLSAAGWIDDAQFPAELERLLAWQSAQLPARLTLAGFDRITPQFQRVLDFLRDAGTDVRSIDTDTSSSVSLKRYPNPDAELIAAGEWARKRLTRLPSLRLAIVVSGLENSSERAGQLVREGLAPGWQYAARTHTDAVNVSYGRKLADYPAIAIALTALRWMHQPLRGEEISLLLRTPMLGGGDMDGRSRLELKVREWPDRYWSRNMFLGAATPATGQGDGAPWLAAWQHVDAQLAALPRRMRPRDWAEQLDELLGVLRWPGDAALNSVDYQLDNRWRNLLNEFARLELVSSTMTLAEAVTRLASMASDAVFQAEAEGAVVAVLGPLEAAGLEFDAIWVTGMTADDWPAAARPLPLLSADLQREHGMPDSTPDDTASYAERVVRRLRTSATECVFSYPATIGDAEQLPTALLIDVDEIAAESAGWHAETLLESRNLVTVADPVPAVAADEVVAGGAGTLSRQAHDPFSAFAFGRLGVRWISRFTTGIAANVRGSLIHDALQALYSELPDRNGLAAWDDAERSRRIETAVDRAFRRHERFADSMLRQLLAIERYRTAALLDRVVSHDAERRAFSIHAVETAIDTRINGVALRLRCDRIDRVGGGEFVILDYKTGVPQKFLSSGDPIDLQLVVYASAVGGSVSGLGLYNVDSSLVDIDGAGPALDDVDDWGERLQSWQADVDALAAALARGDVRLNGHLTRREARPLNLLSRFTELAREH